MNIKKIALITGVALSCASTLASANILITNNTNSHATASAGNSPCSSGAPGGKGVAEPHHTLDVPQLALNLYCKKSCEAKLYMSKSCGTPLVAILKIDQNKGVTNINNLHVDNYVVTGGGSAITISGGPTKKWYQLLF